MKQQYKFNLFFKKLNKREFWFIVILSGFFFKFLLLPFRSGDFNFFLNPWMDFISSNGYFSSLKYRFYNYTPPYIYILIILAKTGINPLYSIKFISILFEYILAFFAGKIIYLKYKNPLNLWISLALIPWIPTVMANGALWGQCDSIYSSFVVAGVYFALINKQFASCFSLGMAIAFKLQGVFILPFYFVMLLRKKINWYYFLLVPLIFVVSVLPAWLYGRPMSELLTIYVNQANNYQALTLYLPNVYTWISNNYYESVKIAGMIVTFFIVLIGGIWLSNKKFHFSLDQWVELAFLSVIITPFLLPGMHERYLYLGDVLAFVYFFVLRKNILYSVGIMSISFYAYLCCSRLKTILPVWPAFFIYLLILILVITDFRKSIKNGTT
ncbi:MAG: hypothetical protein PHG64_02460 [Paludibacter sp.]|nr:hypothetical protein [Paludibacter sp.]